VKKSPCPLMPHHLGINGIDELKICKNLAQEHPSIANCQEEFMRKLKRLGVTNKELLNIGL
jgi:hypothetical protein